MVLCTAIVVLPSLCPSRAAAVLWQLEIAADGSIRENCSGQVFLTSKGVPRETFFSKNLKLLGLGKYFGLNFFKAFGVFSAGIVFCYDRKRWF